MMIAELAASAGVKVSTVRFYERRGLLPAPVRAANGYREYGGEDVRRVRFLRRGQDLGFGLTELAEVLELSGRVRDGLVPGEEVARRGGEKMAEISARIADLERMRTALSGLLAGPCPEPGAPCPVVAALVDVDGPGAG